MLYAWLHHLEPVELRTDTNKQHLRSVPLGHIPDAGRSKHTCAFRTHVDLHAASPNNVNPHVTFRAV